MTNKKPDTHKDVLKINGRETIVFNQLDVDRVNVRVGTNASGVEELAADILLHGLVNALTVRRSGKKATVIAGQQRLAAITKLIEDGVLKKSCKIPVVFSDVTDAEARLISLLENTVRKGMNPADQALVFAGLASDGMTAKEIGSRFGIAERFVVGKINLTKLPDQIMDAFRAGEVDEDQATMLANCEDEALVKEAFDNINQFYNDHQLHNFLFPSELNPNSPIVKLVGLDNYKARDGHIEADLFSKENETVITDNKLICELAVVLLEQEADHQKAEGWSEAIIVQPGLSDDSEGEFISKVLKTMSKTDQKKYDAALAELAELETMYDENEIGFSEYYQKKEKPKDTKNELENKYEHWSDEQKANCFAIIQLSSNQGEILVRYKSHAQSEVPEDEEEIIVEGECVAQETEMSVVFSNSQAEDIIAERTYATQLAIASDPHVAKCILVANFIKDIAKIRGIKVALNISSQNKKDLEEVVHFSAVPEMQALQSSYEAVVGDVEGTEALLEKLVSLTGPEVDKMLAFVVSRQIDVQKMNWDNGTPKAALEPSADMFAKFVKINMGKYFNVSFEFLKRMKIPAIAAAVQSVGDDETAQACISKKRKKDAVEIALPALSKAKWLPEFLKSA